MRSGGGNSMLHGTLRERTRTDLRNRVWKRRGCEYMACKTAPVLWMSFQGRFNFYWSEKHHPLYYLIIIKILSVFCLQQFSSVFGGERGARERVCCFILNWDKIQLLFAAQSASQLNYYGKYLYIALSEKCIYAYIIFAQSRLGELSLFSVMLCGGGGEGAEKNLLMHKFF